MKDKLTVRMFGGFALEYNGKELILDRNMHSKTTQLMQLLMLYSESGGISKAALIDALYGRSDVENKNGSVNNTIFRLRKQLREAGLPDINYINISAGICCWTNEIETEVDVCKFKKLANKLQTEKNEATRSGIESSMCELYHGEFLPDMIGEDWAAIENVKCRDIYFDCVERLCHRLKLDEKFDLLCTIAHNAAEIYPFDDWQIWEIDGLIGLSKYDEGMDLYLKTEKLLLDEMGISPSPEMIEKFKLMGARTTQASCDISDIKDRLSEKTDATGSYFCTFPSFVDMYHIFCRMLERTGTSNYIMLCTLKYDCEISEKKEHSISNFLEEAIKQSTRRSDFYTRYNARQYLIMLHGITHENCDIVSRRINRAFRRMTEGRRVPEINFYVASVEEVSKTSENEIVNEIGAML